MNQDLNVCVRSQFNAQHFKYRKQTLQQAPEDDEKDVVWLLSTNNWIQLEYSDEIQKADNPAI